MLLTPVATNGSAGGDDDDGEEEDDDDEGVGAEEEGGGGGGGVGAGEEFEGRELLLVLGHPRRRPLRRLTAVDLMTQDETRVAQRS